VILSAETKLDMMAKTDALTGLLNRRAGLEYLETAYAECKQKNLPLTVCFADIDGLKSINDTYGHGAGDTMIKSASDVLKRYADKNGEVCRLGGDEFVLILPYTNKEQALLISAQIDRDIKRCLVSGAKGISMSFGFKEAEYTAGETSDALINVADQDMYREKRNKSAK
jgi:diguanylate cyclase (GGDEF)-like protein